MATLDEARDVVRSLPVEQGKAFNSKFKQLKTDEERQIVIDRLVTKFQQPKEEVVTDEIVPAQREVTDIAVRDFPSTTERLQETALTTPAPGVSSILDLIPSIEEVAQADFGELIPEKEEVAESIRSGAEIAPFVGQFAGGLLPTLLTRPQSGLSRTGLLTDQLTKLSRVPGLRRISQELGQQDVLSALSGIAGFTAGKEFELEAEEAPFRTVARAALTGVPGFAGLAGLVPPPPVVPEEERRKAIPEIGKAAGIEVAALLGLRGIGAVAAPPIRFLTQRIPDIIRGLGGVFRATKDLAKQVGFDRVERIAAQMLRKPVGYFTREITPRVQQGINQLINNFTDNTRLFLKELGVSDKAIRTFKRVGINRLRNVQQTLGDNLGVLVDRINKGLKQKLKDAGQVFDRLVNKSPVKEIKLEKMFPKFKRVLINEGLIDEAGRRVGGRTGNRTLDGLVRIFNEMKKFVEGEALDTGILTATGEPIKRKVKQAFSKEQYNLFKIKLQGVLSGDNALDRLVFTVLNDLRQAARDSIAGAKEAFKVYAKAKQNFDLGFDNIKESLLRRKFIDLKTRRMLQQIDDFLPNELKFLKDLDDLNASNEIVKAVDNILDPVQLEKFISRFKGFKDPGVAKINTVQRLLRLLPGGKELSDDALTFFLVQDLFQEILPPGFGGAAGVSRIFFESATREGIKRSAQFERLTRGIRGLPEAVKRAPGRATVAGVTALE